MAASVLMASRDQNTSLTLSEDHRHHHHHHLQTKAAAAAATRHHENQNHRAAAKQSSMVTPARRKLAKGNNEGKTKPRQRGMGVEQLERQRLGEDEWKRMTEINQNNPPPPSLASSPPQLPYAVIPAGSLNTVPLSLAKYNGPFPGRGTNGMATGVGGLNFNQATAALLVPGVGLFHGNGLVPDDNFQGNFLGVGNGCEASKELSSTPNMINFYSDRCCCHQNLVYNAAVKRMNPERSSSFASSDLVGYNVVNNQSNKSGTTHEAFGKNPSFLAGSPYSVSNIEQGKSCFKEYEFFPASGKGSRTHSYESENHEYLMMMTMMMKKAVSGGGSESSSSAAAAVMGGVGDTSCVTNTNTTTTTSGGGVGVGGVVEATSSIDLSLRLSSY